MSNTVPAKWDATKIQSQKGKTAIVTGANSGIGYITALELARHGAHVVLACRSEAKGKDAVNKIEEELKLSPEAGRVEFQKLDVSSLASVKAFADAFKTSHDRLDLLINNAGIMAVPHEETVDGLESQMATNHLGHFALTAQLFDLLKKSEPSRIVNVSSMAHRSALAFDEDQIQMQKSKYDPWLAYSNSKLANILFTRELTTRLHASGVDGVTAVVCHPGSTATNLITAPAEKNSWFYSTIWSCTRFLPIFQTPEMGALPTLYAATASGVQSGQFFGPSGFNALWGYPALETPSKQSQSDSAACKLWEQSETLTGTAFPVAM